MAWTPFMDLIVTALDLKRSEGNVIADKAAETQPSRTMRALLIVGDIDQLPSVGPGQVLAATSRIIMLVC